MVAIAAFLIICVILFGLEAVGGFFFGTLGVLGWVIFGVMALAGIAYLSEWWKDTRRIEKEAEAKRKEAVAKAKARDARLKIENPEQYKKEHAGRRFALWMYGGALAVGLILSVIGIILYLVMK